MNIRLLRIFSTLILIAVLLGACSGTSPTEEKLPLRVSWSLWAGYYPMVIAVDQGFFEKHGVQVEPIFYESYSNQPADLAAGMLDGGAIGLGDSLYDSIGNSVKVVLVLDNSAGAEQIIASPEIQSPKDLRGKRIGVSSPIVNGVLLVRQMLEDNDVPISEVTFVEVPPDKVLGAIPGLVDAGYTYDPYTSEALARGNRVIYTTANATGLGVDVMAFRREIVRDRPEDVRAFVAAWLDAVDYWKHNPAEGNAIIAKVTGLKPEEVSPIGVDLFDRNANLMTFVPGSTYSSVYYTAGKLLEFLLNNGDVTYPVDLKEFLDPSFLK